MPRIGRKKRSECVHDDFYQTRIFNIWRPFKKLKAGSRKQFEEHFVWKTHIKEGAQIPANSKQQDFDRFIEIVVPLDWTIDYAFLFLYYGASKCTYFPPLLCDCLCRIYKWLWGTINLFDQKRSEVNVSWIKWRVEDYIKSAFLSTQLESLGFCLLIDEVTNPLPLRSITSTNWAFTCSVNWEKYLQKNCPYEYTAYFMNAYEMSK